MKGSAKWVKRRALVSVTDKSRLEDLKPLAALGWEFVSTGGTATELIRLGLTIIPVEAVTGFPEMMDGRLKTLHPKIFGGILADRSKREHMNSMKEHGIEPIDLVVVNLYDFNGNPSIEQIDIGGPSLLRAAAKNHEHVTVCCIPEQYKRIVMDIQHNGDTDLKVRRRLAAIVFQETSRYDDEIENWFDSQSM